MVLWALMQTHWGVKGEVHILAFTSGRCHFIGPRRCHFSQWVLGLKAGHTWMGKLCGVWPHRPFLCRWIPKLKLQWNTFHSLWSKWAGMCLWIFVLLVGKWIAFSCKVAPILPAGDHLVPKTLAEVSHQAVVARTNTCLHEITAGLVVSFPVVRTGYSGKASRVTGGLFNIPKWRSPTAPAKAPERFLPSSLSLQGTWRKSG